MHSFDRRPWFASLALALCLALAAAPGRAGSVTYPHGNPRPEYCLSCHTEEVYRRDCDDPTGFCLLANSIDALCLLCHVKEDCCRTGQEHQARLFIGEKCHASDVEVGHVRTAYRPRTLPTHNDRITCRTCHLHTRRTAGDYKMLRIVKRSGDDVDWSPLCADCHEENF